jgi:hypothetical protein
VTGVLKKVCQQTLRVALASLLPLVLATEVCLADVFMRQFPAHPLTDEAVTVSVRASGGIEEVRLSYDTHRLVSDGAGSLTRQPVQQDHPLTTCRPTDRYEMFWCFARVGEGFPDATLVTMKATGVYPDGSEEVESYAFAAGRYPSEAYPIPIRVTGLVAERLDIIFIPDGDIPLEEFRTRISSVVNDKYFAYEVYRGNPEIAYRKLYNFYYTPKFGDYSELCRFTRPANYPTLQQIGDALAILHKETLRDCKSGNLISSEIDYEKTLIHENGHILFGLQDEYCCDSSYQQMPQMPNIWRTRAACEAEAASLAYSPSMCTQISREGRTIDFWRIDPTGEPGSIMGPSQHTDASDHLNANLRRILWRFIQCLDGDCFAQAEQAVSEVEAVPDGAEAEMPTPDRMPAASITVGQLEERLQSTVEQIGKDGIEWEPPGAAAPSAAANFAIELKIDEGGVEVLDISPSRLMPAPPGEERALDLRAVDESGTVLFQTQVADPRMVEIEGQEWMRLDSGELSVVVPAEEGLSELVVQPTGMPSAAMEAFTVEAPHPGMRVELGEALSRLCEGYESLDACAAQ